MEDSKKKDFRSHIHENCSILVQHIESVLVSKTDTGCSTNSVDVSKK